MIITSFKAQTTINKVIKNDMKKNSSTSQGTKLHKKCEKLNICDQNSINKSGEQVDECSGSLKAVLKITYSNEKQRQTTLESIKSKPAHIPHSRLGAALAKASFTQSS